MMSTLQSNRIYIFYKSHFLDAELTYIELRWINLMLISETLNSLDILYL